MFETFELAPPDSILGLNEAFRKDSNPQKINLSVGLSGRVGSDADPAEREGGRATTAG